MIYTVTLNPSIDFFIEVENLKINDLNRMKKEQKIPGGKGINVSRVLSHLGIPSTALGFVGGFTGEFIRNTLIKEGLQVDFVEVETDSRINIKLHSNLKDETEINGQGPIISPEKLAELCKKLKRIQPQEWVVLAGSIPASLPEHIYEDWTKDLSQRGIRVVVDVAGKSLLNVVKSRPFLIKPNHHELGELFHVHLNSVQEIIPYGCELVERGVKNVIVSMGGDGALLFTTEAIYWARTPTWKVVNSVGAGDSLVAGFIGTYTQTKDLLYSFRYGVAAGSATAFSQDLCTKDMIEQVLPQVRIQKI
jgi:1-phosphofructokinase